MEHNKKIFTIPNLLTTLRILMIPVFVYYYMQDDHIMCAGWILASGLTDFLDGYIARHYHQISELGKALDPFADKLTQFAIIAMLSYKVPYMVYLFILFLVKEASMLGCWIALKKKGGYINGALWFGKVSTAVFYICMFALIAFPIAGSIWGNLLMIATAFFLGLSFILYIRTYRSLFRGLSS